MEDPPSKFAKAFFQPGASIDGIFDIIDELKGKMKENEFERFWTSLSTCLGQELRQHLVLLQQEECMSLISASSVIKKGLCKPVLVVLEHIWAAVVKRLIEFYKTPDNQGKPCVYTQFFAETCSVVFKRLCFLDLEVVEENSPTLGQFSRLSCSVENYKLWLNFLVTKYLANYKTAIMSAEKVNGTIVTLYEIISSFCMTNYLARYALLFKRKGWSTDAEIQECQKYEVDIIRHITKEDIFVSVRPLSLFASHFIRIFQDQVPNELSLSCLFQFLSQYFSRATSYPTDEVLQATPIIIDAKNMQKWRSLCVSYGVQELTPASLKEPVLIELSCFARDVLFMDFVFTVDTNFEIFSQDQVFYLQKKCQLQKDSNECGKHLEHLADLYTLFENDPVLFRIITRCCILQDALAGHFLDCTNKSQEATATCSRLLACSLKTSATHAKAVDYFIQDLLKMIEKLDNSPRKLQDLFQCAKIYLKRGMHALNPKLFIQSISETGWIALQTQHQKYLAGKSKCPSILSDIVLESLRSSQDPAKMEGLCLSSSLYLYLPLALSGPLNTAMFMDIYLAGNEKSGKGQDVAFLQVLEATLRIHSPQDGANSASNLRAIKALRDMFDIFHSGDFDRIKDFMYIKPEKMDKLTLNMAYHEFQRILFSNSKLMPDLSKLYYEFRCVRSEDKPHDMADAEEGEVDEVEAKSIENYEVIFMPVKRALGESDPCPRVTEKRSRLISLMSTLDSLKKPVPKTSTAFKSHVKELGDAWIEFACWKLPHSLFIKMIQGLFHKIPCQKSPILFENVFMYFLARLPQFVDPLFDQLVQQRLDALQADKMPYDKRSSTFHAVIATFENRQGDMDAGFQLEILKKLTTSLERHLLEAGSQVAMKGLSSFCPNVLASWIVDCAKVATEPVVNEYCAWLMDQVDMEEFQLKETQARQLAHVSVLLRKLAEKEASLASEYRIVGAIATRLFQKPLGDEKVGLLSMRVSESYPLDFLIERYLLSSQSLNLLSWLLNHHFEPPSDENESMDMIMPTRKNQQGPKTIPMSRHAVFAETLYKPRLLDASVALVCIDRFFRALVLPQNKAIASSPPTWFFEAWIPEIVQTLVHSTAPQNSFAYHLFEYLASHKVLFPILFLKEFETGMAIPMSGLWILFDCLSKNEFSARTSMILDVATFGMIQLPPLDSSYFVWILHLVPIVSRMEISRLKDKVVGLFSNVTQCAKSAGCNVFSLFIGQLLEKSITRQVAHVEFLDDVIYKLIDQAHLPLVDFYSKNDHFKCFQFELEKKAVGLCMSLDDIRDEMKEEGEENMVVEYSRSFFNYLGHLTRSNRLQLPVGYYLFLSSKPILEFVVKLCLEVEKGERREKGISLLVFILQRKCPLVDTSFTSRLFQCLQPYVRVIMDDLVQSWNNRHGMSLLMNLAFKMEKTKPHQLFLQSFHVELIQYMKSKDLTCHPILESVIDLDMKLQRATQALI